ncbi:MAG: LPS export ABC transporter periplasmic protein LptC [Candidatus Hydrothermia bacterium]
MTLKKLFEIHLALWIFALLLLNTISCEESKQKKPDLDSEDSLRQETYNVYFEVKDYEIKKLGVFAQKAEYKGDTTLIYDFKVNFYENDSIVATMTGDTGKVQEYSGLMEVTGNVKIVSMTGDSLLSRRIIWDKKINSIYSPEESVLFREGKIIKSTGLESNPQLTRVTFKGKVYVE